MKNQGKTVQSKSVVNFQQSFSMAKASERNMMSMTAAVWPPKYGTQREPIPEVPRACVEKLLQAMDEDMDGRVSRQELQRFASRSSLSSITPDVVDQMFEEIAQRRPLVHKAQFFNPIALEELVAVFKGRYSWKSDSKQWAIEFRPFYSQWTTLLKLVNTDIYAPLPELIVPQKIVAQYEAPLANAPRSYTASYGHSRSHVSEIPRPLMPERERHEANVNLNSSDGFKVLSTKEFAVEKLHGFEKVTNERLQDLDKTKISFEAKEYYDQVKKLSNSKPLFKTESENPIYRFIPEGKKRRTHSSQGYVLGALQPQQLQQDSPSQRFFQTAFKIDDCATTKGKLAKEDPIEDSYLIPHNHAFRDLYQPIGRADFKLRFKCPPAYNHLGISEHDRRPKDAMDRVRRQKEMEERQAKEYYQMMLTGVSKKDAYWQRFIKGVDKFGQIGTGSSHPLFKREEYIDPMVSIARSMRDDVVFGKPIFRLYAKPLKPSDINTELGGLKKPFKVLH